MKKLQCLTFGMLAMTAATIGRAQITDPGWFEVPQTMILQDSSTITNSGYHSYGSSQIYVPATPIAEVITPHIQALADGLQDDPQQIFNYVHDHIKFVLYFGSKKGAELTLLEKSGNEFDQCALLVAMLRAAGYTNVQYLFGWQVVPYDDPAGKDYDLHHWWRLSLLNTNWDNTKSYIGNLVGTRGYPAGSYLNDGSNNYFLFQRMWVALTIGTNTYQLDPAFKVSEPINVLNGFSLTNALGGTSATISNALFSAAAGTDNGNYAQSLNEAALRSKLASYTTNLLNYIQSNAPNASVEDILGGWRITPAYDPVDYSLTNHFPITTFSGQLPVWVWANQPTNTMSTLAITFAGTTNQWFMPQLQGQRLSLTFDTGGTAQLWQDDTLLASQATAGPSSTTNVVIAVTHPMGSWDMVNNVFVPNPTNVANMTITNSYQRTNATYAIIYAFEPDWGWLEQRENKLDAYLQQGLTNGTRQVLSETLNINGLNWLLQTAQADELLSRQLNILPESFHRIGRMAQEVGKGYYVDVYVQFTGSYSSSGNDAASTQAYNAHFDLWSFWESALEHGVIEQLQTTNLVGASTVKMLQIANTNNQAVYLASSTNWTTGYNVRSHITGYDSKELGRLTNFINQGFYVLLPQNGSNHVSSTAGSWAGFGYEARQTTNGHSASQMLIGGGYHGGFASDPFAVVNTAYTGLTAFSQPTYFSSTPSFTPLFSIGDPLDAADATLELEATDLAVGRDEPRGINLSRHYNGTRRSSNLSGMAPGWIHNYTITANNIAAAKAGLGGTTPAQAAPFITAMAAAMATYNGGTPNAKNWLTTILITKWSVDQLIKNGVSVSLGKDTLQFVKQPNGVFTPPANCTSTLTQNGASYNFQQRHGNTFTFNASGLLTNIVDQYGQSLNLTYNASNWVSTVKDWKNRTFTFNYTGTPSRLTSVSDGTRTVSYGYSTAYNPQGDLTSFTDAEGKTSTYVYDTNHQITATLDAQSRLVVSNVYDSQGHITTQYTQGDTNQTWHIFWSGFQTIEQDPAGSQRVFFYDDKSRLVAKENQLGYLEQTFYDGQNHVIKTISALNETNQFFYDGNHNRTSTIDPLGFTNRSVYDTQNNLVQSIDARGNVSTFGYNSKFQLTGSTNGAGDFTAYTYNSTDGALSTRMDPAGTTSYGYDSFGQLNSITYPNSLGSESFANSSLGDVTSHTDGRGFITTFGYNNRRQLTNTVAPTNVITSTSYDSVGNVQTTTDARNFSTINYWSATRHLIGTKLPNGAATTNFYDSRDWLVETLDPLQQPTILTNDLAGQLISSTDPLSRTTTFGLDADGRTIATTNGAGESTSQTWDGLGRLLRVTDGAGRFSTRVYDSAGNQIALTNRNGKLWQFQFDAANRLTNTITPSGRQVSQTWNHQGLLASVKQPSGKTATFSYNARGKLTNQTDAVATTFYNYDANNNLVSVTNAGQGLSVSQTFDAYNRISSYKDVYGNLIQYRYDANGNLTNLIYPGGKNVYYTYDSQNQMTNVTDWANRKTTFTYDLANRMTSITRPNGTVRLISYNAAGQVTNIVEKTTGNYPITFFTLNFDNAARVQWEFGAPLCSNSPPTRTMTYDDDNRLVTVNGQNVYSDADGNLTNAPLADGTMAAYTYDARNRLLTVGGVTNVYDPVGNRIGQTYGTNSVSYVVNPNAKLTQVLMRVKNSITNFYVYGAGLLYEVTEATSGTNMLTYHFDYRGSTVSLADSNGIPTDRIAYSAYGLTAYRSGTSDTPFLFHGRYGVMTEPNGLVFMRARSYNPYLCRFINPDPSAFSGGLNFYAYANGNPVSIIDPIGLDPAVAPGIGMFSGLTAAQQVDASRTAAPFVGGVVIGAAGAGLIVVVAPAVVVVGSELITTATAVTTSTGLGVSAATATTLSQAAVTVGLGGAAVYGGVSTVLNTIDNANAGNWDAVAFNVGTLTGGSTVGAFGGGDAIQFGISGRPTSASPGLFGDIGLGYNPNFQNGSILTWLASGPSPQSGGASAAFAASGAGLLLQSSVISGIQSSSTGK